MSGWRRPDCCPRSPHRKLDNITEQAVGQFADAYPNEMVTKDVVFLYV